MRKLLTFAIIFTLVVPSLLFAQQKRGPSTPEERARAVEIAQRFQNDPLNPASVNDREWLLRWLTEVPDISVTICGANMPWKAKYRYAGDLIAVNLASSASYVIQHPEDATLQEKIATAAAESMIGAYKKILASDPKARSKEFDEMVSAQEQGKLAEYVKARWQTMCKK